MAGRKCCLCRRGNDMSNVNFSLRRLSVLVGALALGACAIVPTGPSVMVLPGTGQSIERFRQDDAYCRDFSLIQIGGKTRARLRENLWQPVLPWGRPSGLWRVRQLAVGAKVLRSVPAPDCLLVQPSAVVVLVPRASGRSDNTTMLSSSACMPRGIASLCRPAWQRPRARQSSTAMSGIPPPPPGTPPPPPPGSPPPPPPSAK